MKNLKDVIATVTAEKKKTVCIWWRFMQFYTFNTPINANKCDKLIEIKFLDGSNISVEVIERDLSEPKTR